MTDRSLRAPRTVRSAGVIVAVQGIAGVLAAVVYVVTGIRGGDEPGLNMFGTAAYFVIIGGAVLAAGRALWTGRRWGRGVAVFAQLLLLPVAWYLAVGSGQWIYGIGVAIVALITLVLLFSPSAVQWLSAQDSDSSAPSADNSGPETR